ncbi:MAG: ABC transporter permease [Candidatus Pacebacteria bacterium]|nr:ABC transporter permease [Candidatus Paceibacterota bacterium]
MLNVYQTIRTALLDLSLHKVRTGMAALGVMFGVASVVSMLAISEGAKRESLSRIKSMGVDNIIVRSVQPAGTTPTANSETESVPYQAYGLKARDLHHVTKTFANVRRTAGVRSKRYKLSTLQDKSISVPVIATEHDYLAVTRTTILRGRFLQPLDGAEHRRVCVLGRNAVRTLFAFTDPLRQRLLIGGQWFRVVGIVENKAELTAVGSDDLINDHVFIPLNTARVIFGDVQPAQNGTGLIHVEIDAAIIQALSENHVMPLKNRLSNYLLHTHPKKDYEIVVPLALLRQKESTQKMFTIVMSAIAGISLLVGGIGIMNIMLANVSERRKEIGMRRALGACRRDILLQFLVEAMTLTGLGGLIGIGMGFAVAYTVNTYARMPVTIPLWSVVLGLGVSVAVGMVFGLWPAHTAAAVNPIDALRSE